MNEIRTELKLVKEILIITTVWVIAFIILLFFVGSHWLTYIFGGIALFIIVTAVLKVSDLLNSMIDTIEYLYTSKKDKE